MDVDRDDDLDVGDTTKPFVYDHAKYARPSSMYPMTATDTEGPTTLWDRDGDEVPTVNGRMARSYAAYEDVVPRRAVGTQNPAATMRQGRVRRSVPPPIPPRRARRVTPVELDTSYEAALRRFR